MSWGNLERRFDAQPYKQERLDVLKKLSRINHLPLKRVVKFSKRITSEYNNEVYIGLENIESNTGLYSKSISEKDSISTAIQFGENEILFPKLRPYLNKVHYSKFKGICSTEFYVLTSKREDIENKFLFYFLNSNLVLFQTRNLMTGNTLPRLQTNDVEDLKIPLLEKTKQLEIIQKMDDSLSLLQSNKEKIGEHLVNIDIYLKEILKISLKLQSNYDLKKRRYISYSKQFIGKRYDAYYNQPFFNKEVEALQNGKYPLVKLKTLCHKITDGTHYTPNYVEEGVTFISVKNVRRGKISFDDVKYISEEEHEHLIKRAKPEINDILLTKVGTIGLAAVIEEGMPEFSIFVSVALLKPNIEKVNPYYLSELLSSPVVKFQFERDLKGVGVPDLHLENIEDALIPLPSMEIQNEIADKIKVIRAEAAKLEKEANEILEKAKQEVEQMILQE